MHADVNSRVEHHHVSTPPPDAMTASWYLASRVRMTSGVLQASLEHMARSLRPGIWAGAMDVHTRSTQDAGQDRHVRS